MLASDSTSPFVLIDGGSHAIASTANEPLFRLAGRQSANTSQVISTPELSPSMSSTLSLGNDEPLRRTGSGAYVEISGATVTAHRGLVMDDALLAASAPLLTIKSSASLTTSQEGLNLIGAAKLTATGPLVRLDGGILTIGSGHAVRVSGSFLNTTGDLISILNGGRLNVNGGGVLFINDNGVVRIGGGLVNFNNSTGQLNVTNSFCSGTCSSFGGVPVHFQNGASSSNVNITNGIKNSGSATINFSGPAAAAIILDGANAKVIISGN